MSQNIQATQDATNKNIANLQTTQTSSSGSHGSANNQKISRDFQQKTLEISIIKKLSNRLKIETEKVTQLFDFMAKTYVHTSINNATNTTSNSSSLTYGSLQSSLKSLLSEIKYKLHAINELRIDCEKNILNEKLVEQLNKEWSSLEKTIRDSTTILIQNANILQPTLSDTQNNCLEIILTGIQKLFQQDNFSSDSTLTKAELLQRLSYKLCKYTLSTLTPVFNSKPTCFICYSWSSAANAKQVHKIAKNLKAAGIRVILDIWSNTTGSMHAFIEKVKTADYVIVAGTPDLVEKWNIFTKEGNSVKQTERSYQDDIVCAELEMILTRLTDRGNNDHNIINLLIQGDHKSSFPNRLATLPSNNTDFSTHDKYIDSLFNLLLKLVPENSGPTSKYGNYSLIIEQKRKEIRERIKVMQGWNDAELLSLYQENIESNKHHEILKAEILQSFKPFKEVRLSSPKSITVTGAATTSGSILWNIPSQHHLFIGREILLEELHQELGIQPKTVTQTVTKLNALAIAAFSGLGGIGKTQLALKYIRDTKHPYTLKAWFQAEKIEELKQNLTEFAKFIGYTDQKISFKSAFLFLKQWLTQNPDWLIVYDNVTSYEEIASLLPDSGGSVILTSRNQEWPNSFKKLDIKVMTEEESVKLIQSIIKRDKELTETKELAKILGYLPLAMTQASAYIAQKHKSIENYLKLYKTQQVKLLADKTFPKGTNHLSVAATWNVTLEILPKEARELLTVCSYLAPEKISRALLLTWLKKAHPEIEEPEDIFENHISQLGQYSFIEYERDSHINVHRLVQAILRHQHQSDTNKSSVEWLNTLLAAVDTEFNHESQGLEDIVRHKELLPHLYTVIEHFETLHPKSPSVELANVLCITGYALMFYVLDPNKAKIYLEKCLSISQANANTNPLTIAKALNSLGAAYSFLGNHQKEKELLEQALDIKERNFGKEHYEVAITLNNLGMTYSHLGNHQKQKELLEQALPSFERHFGKKHYRIAIILNNLGNAYGSLGNYHKQKEFLEQALEIKEHNFGKEHFQVAATLYNLGNVYGNLGNVNKQKELLEQALIIQERHFGKEHVETASTLQSLGETYGRLGYPQKQKELLEQTLPIQQHLLGKEHFQVANTSHSLGNAYGSLKNYPKQKELLENALDIKERHFGKEHIEVAAILNDLGEVNGKLGNIQKQKELLEQALIIKDKHYSKEHKEHSSQDMAISYGNLATCYQQLNEIQKAYHAAERCLAIYKNIYGEQHSETENARGLFKRCEKAWLESKDGKSMTVKSPTHNAISTSVANTTSPNTSTNTSIKNNQQPENKFKL